MNGRGSDKRAKKIRHLVLILGDQLNRTSSAFDGFDPRLDAVWMAEVQGEATHVKSHKARIALFLSAMRHFREALIDEGIRVIYRGLEAPDNRGSLAEELRFALKHHKPKEIILCEPGEWRVREELLKAAKAERKNLEIRPDRHFICSSERFQAHIKGRKSLRLEFFYREMRRQNGILMEADKPLGGKWNYDAQNRKPFGKEGPGKITPPRSFKPDAITREVLALVRARFPDHPGSLDRFDWPVTPKGAASALRSFVKHHLAEFGPYQDAMWSNSPYLHHSRLASAMNLKLLDPRKVIEKALGALEKGRAPLSSVEGYVRQVLGWREYVRAIYRQFMPGYLERNALDAQLSLPGFYWTGETEMECLRQAIGQTLEYGYAHHIQRLMVTGLFALLLGVDPKEVHEWYLAIYVDAVEWVELPNTLGMSQYADEGIMASKPYVATGKYIQRMSNYCRNCRFKPQNATGDDACPFTTLYWDFLIRHERKLRDNARMRLQINNLGKKSRGERNALLKTASALKSRWS